MFQQVHCSKEIGLRKNGRKNKQDKLQWQWKVKWNTRIYLTSSQMITHALKRKWKEIQRYNLRQTHSQRVDRFMRPGWTLFSHWMSHPRYSTQQRVELHCYSSLLNSGSECVLESISDSLMMISNSTLKIKTNQMKTNHFNHIKTS